jgi:hypothetical protein
LLNEKWVIDEIKEYPRQYSAKRAMLEVSQYPTSNYSTKQWQ